MGQRPNDLTPEKDGWHLWGAQLRSLRERSGMSCRSLARTVNYDPSTLSKAENATRPPSPDLAKACDRALQANGTLTDLHAAIVAAELPRRYGGSHADSAGCHDDNRPETVRSSEGRAYDWLGPVDTLVPVTNAEGRTVYVPTTRRDLLKGIGATAGIATLGGVSNLANSGAGLVEHFRQMRVTLADNDNLFGASRVISVAADQLDRMHVLRKNLRAGALRDSFQVQAEFADLLGWLRQDSGDHAAAQYWLGRALEFSHMSGNAESVAFILSRKSQLAADMGDASGAILSGEAGVGMAASNPRIAAISATQAAHGHAIAGDAYSCELSYEHARGLLSSHGGDESPWGQFFGVHYLNVYEAHSHAALGDYQTAATEYEAAVRAVPHGFRRDQGVYMAHQAHTHARGGDDEKAAALGVQALAVNSETGSARGLRELVRLRVTLSTVDSASARTFCSAMSDFTATQGRL